MSSLSPAQLATFVARQMDTFFPDGIKIDIDTLEAATNQALAKYEFCCEHIGLKYFRQDNRPLFHHLHSDQYAMILYLLSRTLYERQAVDLAARAYYLNKALHALDIFYEVVLPPVFLLSHPIGTVLGRANYGNFLCVYQNCTVGSNFGVYPRLGEKVVLYAGSTVVGRSDIGDNTIISAQAFIRDESVPGNSMAFGHSPSLAIKPLSKDIDRDIFRCPILP